MPVDRLMAIVTTTDLGEDCDEKFLSVAMAIVALAISKLPAREREETLQYIEAGTLRYAVNQFPNAQRVTTTQESAYERLN
jgi:hypothetical protein